MVSALFIALGVSLAALFAEWQANHGGNQCPQAQPPTGIQSAARTHDSGLALVCDLASIVPHCQEANTAVSLGTSIYGALVELHKAQAPKDTAQ